MLDAHFGAGGTRIQFLRICDQTVAHWLDLDQASAIGDETSDVCEILSRPVRRVPTRSSKLRKGCAARLHRVVHELMATTVYRCYLDRQDLPVTVVYGHLARELKRLEREAAEPDQPEIKLPHVSTLRRYISRLDPQEVIAARWGKHARWQFKKYGPRQTRPLKIVREVLP